MQCCQLKENYRKYMGTSKAGRGKLMSVKYKYSGLTPELYQRLVDEHAELRKAHKRALTSSFSKK